MGQCCSSKEGPGSGDAPETFHTRERSCTDIPCCLLFAIFVASFLLVTLWCFAVGDYRRVLYPTDSKGRICGKDVQGKPYLYFFDLARCFTFAPAYVALLGCPTLQVCVKSCPNYTWSWAFSNPDRASMICLEGKDATAPEFINYSVRDLVSTHQCAPYIFNSKPIMGRCMPSQLTQLTMRLSSQNTVGDSPQVTFTNEQNETVSASSVVRGRNLIMQVTGFIEKVASDFSESWPTIVTCIGLAVILSLVWVALLRCCAAIIVWCSLILLVLLFGTFAAFSFYRWHYLKTQPESIPEALELDFSLYFRLSSLWLAFGIVSATCMAITILLILALRTRINIAIAIISETSKALTHMSSLLLWPILPLVLELAVILQAAFVAICLRSISDPVGTSASANDSMADQARKTLQNMFQLIPCDPTSNSSAGIACRFLYYGDKKYVIFIQMFNLFVTFWVINFIRSLADMTLAGAFAEYYYSQRNSHAMSKCPLLPSLFRAARYHCGSMAFGSLILALLQWLRVLFEYLEAKFNQFDNQFARAMLRCCCCMMWCLEKFLRFLNRNAFIMIAIHGQSFCSGARSAFSLLSRNILRVIVIDKLASFLLFVGKLLVILTCAALAYLHMAGILFANTVLAEYQPTLHFIVIPVVIVTLMSYIIASLFFSVFDMGVDTIFLCFLEDVDRNDGSLDRPYHMSSRLLQIVGKKNRLDPLKRANAEDTSN